MQPKGIQELAIHAHKEQREKFKQKALSEGGLNIITIANETL